MTTEECPVADSPEHRSRSCVFCLRVALEAERRRADAATDEYCRVTKERDAAMAGVATLFAAVAHGDAEHRTWLKDAIDAHFAGRPVPPPAGRGAMEAERRRADAATADAVALREALNAIGGTAAEVRAENTPEFMDWLKQRLEAACAVYDAPHPGAALLERVKRLEAVAEAVGRYRDVEPGDDVGLEVAWRDLSAALVRLDEAEGGADAAV